MGRKAWPIMAVSVLVTLIFACAAPKRFESVRQSSKPTHHWIQNDQLQLLMKQLDAYSGEHWPANLPDDPEVSMSEKERKEAFHNAAELAGELSDAAARIPHTIIDDQLSEADRIAFIGTAQVLGDQARNLRNSARRNHLEDMHKELDAIRATCISCHTRFKDISGELPPRT